MYNNYNSSKEEKTMKRISALIISIAILLSIAIPVGAGAAVETVSGLKQTNAETNRVDFEWEPVFGQNVKYEIQMGKTLDDLQTVRDDYYFTDYYTTNLSAGKSYYARVRAKIDDVPGEWSEPLEIVTVPEETKSFVQTDCTTNSATFKWDAVEGATAYRVCEFNGQEKVIATTKDTTYTLKGMNNKTALESKIFVKPIREGAAYTAEKIYEYIYSWDSFAITADEIKLTPKKVNTPVVDVIYSGLQLVSCSTSKVPFASNYQYAVYDAKNKKVFSGSSQTPSVDAKRGQFYKIRMRAYTTISATNKTKYGTWSDYKYFGYGANVSAKKIKKTNIKASWNKFKGATNYTVYISKSANGGFKKAGTTKKTSFTIKKFGKKKITKKGTYYVKVVANKKVGKKTIKSTDNSVASVR